MSKTEFPVLMYHPDTADHIVSVSSHKELYDHQQRGFRHVRLEKITRVLKRTRTKLKMSVQEFSRLVVSRGVYLTPKQLTKLEKNSVPEMLTIGMISSLAIACGVSVGEMIHTRKHTWLPIQPRTADKYREFKSFRITATTNKGCATMIVQAYDKAAARERALRYVAFYKKHDDVRITCVEEVSNKSGVVLYVGDYGEEQQTYDHGDAAAERGSEESVEQPQHCVQAKPD